MVGDIAQLSPVLDKPLYCPVSEDPMAMMRFFAFRTIDHVAKLEQNVRASLADDRHEFRELLLRLQYGESHYFSSKQISNFKTRLAQTNEAVSTCNYNMLLKNGTTIITVKANHNIKQIKLLLKTLEA